MKKAPIIYLLPLLLHFSTGVSFGAQPSGSSILNTGIEKSVIKIDHRFRGSKISLLGNKSKTAQDIVVIMTSESKPRSIAKKTKGKLNMWSVSSITKLQSVPTFYQLLSNKPISKIFPRSTLSSLEIGIENINFKHEANHNLAQAFEASRNIVKESIRDGLFVEHHKNGIRMLDCGTLFKANIAIPSNIKEGGYSVTTILVENKEIKAINVDPFYVEKIGLSYKMAVLSKYHRKIYFGLAFCIAVMVGILGFFLTLLVRRIN